ncbi:type II secretion system minor pseudopilin GspH [Pectobacterium cacticida]|uniref:Type II secretion system protein H n=1 Tax=Pectobacterium cacticida TaxID=69221 RepID=A0ABZ2G9D6_9GAMM|nr:type II secretion system minor pseudopilin GspH [Pectobacterium cacticida]UYX07971.1 type II secretion system minor pseudopilin GspH [Pectobacterium cacticida]
MKRSMNGQQGFTLLEMMLVVLLAGIAAGMVVMTFPPERQNDSAWQVERFRAQLAFAAESSQVNDYMLGVRLFPDRWQFYQLQRPVAAEGVPVASGDRWQGYQWQPWRPHRVNTSATLPETLRLELLGAGGKKADKTQRGDDPDILILPGGEITPFRLRVAAENKSLSHWLEVDAFGRLVTSMDQDEKR